MRKNIVTLTAILMSTLTANTALANTTTEFRKAIEEKGGTVTWNSVNKSVKADIGQITIAFIVGDDTVTVNGVKEKVKTYIEEVRRIKQ